MMCDVSHLSVHRLDVALLFGHGAASLRNIPQFCVLRDRHLEVDPTLAQMPTAAATAPSSSPPAHTKPTTSRRMRSIKTYQGLSLVGTPWIRSTSGWVVIFLISSGSVTSTLTVPAKRASFLLSLLVSIMMVVVAAAVVVALPLLWI